MATDADKRIFELEQQVKILVDASRQSDLIRKRYQDSLSILKQKDHEIKMSKEMIEKDLDMLKKMQQELVEKEKMAALGTLVAGVAHEVNTPLGVAVTSITACSEEIRSLKRLYELEELSESDMETFLETASESAQIVHKSLNQAARLIHSFKKISVDQNIDDVRQIDVYEYIQDIIRTFSNQLKKTRINVELKCSQGIIVKTYPGSLAQILSNLLINTINHAYNSNQQGKVIIKINLDGNRLYILFMDDGQGMDDELKAHAFQPFVTTGRDKGGSGLGLYIVYNLVTQRFGGHIKLESQIGKGSRFFMTLIVEVPG